MAAHTTLNLWMAHTTAERDALGTEHGLARGDFCLVDQTNLYTATAVAATSSTWQPLAGLPTTGPYGLGARNTADTNPQSCYTLAAITFRAVLDAAPTSVTLAPDNMLHWPVVPDVLFVTATGFVLEGTSSSVASGVDAWTHGTYTVTY